MLLLHFKDYQWLLLQAEHLLQNLRSMRIRLNLNLSTRENTQAKLYIMTPKTLRTKLTTQDQMVNILNIDQCQAKVQVVPILVNRNDWKYCMRERDLHPKIIMSRRAPSMKVGSGTLIHKLTGEMTTRPKKCSVMAIELIQLITKHTPRKNIRTWMLETWAIQPLLRLVSTSKRQDPSVSTVRMLIFPKVPDSTLMSRTTGRKTSRKVQGSTILGLLRWPVSTIAQFKTQVSAKITARRSFHLSSNAPMKTWRNPSNLVASQSMRRVSGRVRHHTLRILAKMSDEHH